MRKTFRDFNHRRFWGGHNGYFSALREADRIELGDLECSFYSTIQIKGVSIHRLTQIYADSGM